MNEKERWLAGEDLENENLSPDEEAIHEQNKTIQRLKEQLNEANKLLRYCCANYESSRFGATITEDGEILPKGPVWNYIKKWGVK